MKFGIISNKVGNIPNSLEALRNQKNWKNAKIFGINSKRIGIISKKVGNFPKNLELDLNHFQKIGKIPKEME